MKNFILVFVVGSLFLAASCGSTQEEKKELPVAKKEADAAYIASGGDVYICPCGGCPEIKMAEGGACPKCKMDLVLADKTAPEKDVGHQHDHSHDQGDGHSHDHAH